MSYNKDFVLEPGIAEEISSNGDGTEWTIRLRQGVEFHNGKTLTAEDVAYTIARILNPDTGASGTFVLASIDPEAYTILDERTVRYKLLQPVARLQDLLCTPLSGIVPVDYDPTNPVGTGPFRYVSFTAGRQSVFERFENYWDTPAYVDELEILDMNDTTARLNALRSGQIHAADYVPFAQVSELKGEAGITVLPTDTGRTLRFAMRCDTPPFDDVRVRQAFRLIADREELVAQVLVGNGSVANDLYSPWDPCFASDLPQRVRNLEEARRLLREANQEDLSVELIATEFSQGTTAMSAVFAAQAADAGVTVNVREVDTTAFYSQYWMQAPFTVTAIPNRPYLTATAYAMLTDSPYNEIHLNDEEFDSLYVQALAEMDDSARCALVHQMQEIQYERGGYLTWGYVQNSDAYAQVVTGFTPNSRFAYSFNDYKFRLASLS